MAVEQTAIVKRDRTYPHIGSFDRVSQQAVRILYDGKFSAEERLQAAESTITSLISTINSQADQIAAMQQQIDQALAPTQPVT